MERIYHKREEATQAAADLIETCYKVGCEHIMLDLLLPKKQLTLEDYPKDIREKLKFTTIHADINSKATTFDIAEITTLLTPEQTKKFITTTLNTQKWFAVRTPKKEIRYIEHPNEKPI